MTTQQQAQLLRQTTDSTPDHGARKRIDRSLQEIEDALNRINLLLLRMAAFTGQRPPGDGGAQ